MRVFFSAGTDTHPYDRLVTWADEWAVSHPVDDVFVQFGSSRTPSRASGSELLGRNEMIERLTGSDVVVLSCGPGAVMDARGVGRKPIVVPRRPDLGEHVDGHQLTFARHLDAHGLAVLVEDERGLERVIEQARTNPDLFRVAPDASEPPGIGRLGALVDQMMGVRRGPGRSTS